VTATSSIRRFLWPRSLAGKAGVVALAFAVLLMVLWFAALRYSSQRLAAAWKLSDEFGYPNDFQALLGPRVAPEKNMTVPLDRASSTAVNFMATERAKRQIVEQDPLDDPSFLAAMDALIADPNFEGALAEADRLPEYRSPVVEVHPLFNIMLTYLQTRRDLVRAEQAITRRLVAQGKSDEAARKLLRHHRLTRRWEDKEPFLIAALVNIAIRTILIEELNLILRRGPLPPELHDEIERELAQTETILRVLPQIAQTEKIAAIDAYDEFTPLQKYAALRPVLRPISDNDKAYLLQHLHRWMKVSDRPYYEVKIELDALDDELKRVHSDPVGHFLHLGSTMLLPATNSVRQAFDRMIAKARCLRILNAWSRRNNFSLPLESLGLPQECLIDPFNGKRLMTKTTPDGPVIYSVGPDLKDDGGQFVVGAGKGWDVGLEPPKPPAKKK